MVRSFRMGSGSPPWTGWAVLACACSGGSPAAEGSGGRDAGGAVALTLRLEQLTGIGVEGAAVCTYPREAGPCATADALGKAVFHVPAGSETAYTVEAPTYSPTLLPVRVADADVEIDYTITPQALFDAALGVAGLVQSPERGAIVLGVWADGATVRIDPASGDGPLYFDAAGVPDPQRATAAERGGAAFLNVEPGIVEVVVSHPERPCEHRESSWRGGAPGASRVPVAAGWGTGLRRASCP